MKLKHSKLKYLCTMLLLLFSSFHLGTNIIKAGNHLTEKAHHNPSATKKNNITELKIRTHTAQKITSKYNSTKHTNSLKLAYRNSKQPNTTTNLKIASSQKSKTIITDIIKKLDKKTTQQKINNKKIKTKTIRVKRKIKNKRKSRRKLIVIDPGHGGRDPGAISYSKRKEKDLVLNFSKRLAAYLEKNYGYKTILTRYNDIYIPLRKRSAIAHKKKADLFLSIHADYSPVSKHAKGTTIFILSDRASDKEAAQIAKNENLSDAIAGVKIQKNQNKDINNILIDLAQRESISNAVSFARSLERRLRTKRHIRTRRPFIKYAGFTVLKTLDVPSVLLELGFLSNKSDARNIKSIAWTNSYIETLSRAIRDHFKK